jgi:hypothetical protein
MGLLREVVDCIGLIWEKGRGVECRRAVMKFFLLNSRAAGWNVFE